MTRRILNEIKTFIPSNLKESDDDDMFRYLNYLDDDCYFIILPKIMYIKNKILITMNFTDSNHPFLPPKNVMINSYNYRDLLIPTRLVQTFLKNKTDIKCMCCSTLMCRHNWNPMIRLRELLEEIVKFIIIKKRALEYFHTKKIINKYFGFYLPIIEFI